MITSEFLSLSHLKTVFPSVQPASTLVDEKCQAAQTTFCLFLFGYSYSILKTWWKHTCILWHKQCHEIFYFPINRSTSSASPILCKIVFKIVANLLLYPYIKVLQFFKINKQPVRVSPRCELNWTDYYCNKGQGSTSTIFLALSSDPSPQRIVILCPVPDSAILLQRRVSNIFYHGQIKLQEHPCDFAASRRKTIL